MKKYIIAFLILSFGFTSIAYGAGVFQVFQGGTGASTLTGCLEGHGTGPITGTGSSCGSGSGGSGTGWASSTDPTSIYFTGSNNVGIGTSSPYAKLSVAGQIVGQYFTATSSGDTSTFAGPMRVDGSIDAQGGISISSNSTVLNTYGLYFGNTSNTFIQSSDADSDLYLYALDQITLEAASVSTNILSINTKIRTAAGSAAAPAFGWASDDDGSGTGFYQNAANRIGVTINGNYIGQFLSTGIDFSSVIKTLSYFDGQLRGTAFMSTSATEGFARQSAGVIKVTDGSGNITPDLLTDKLGAGTTTPWGILSASTTSATEPALAVEQKSTGPAAVFYKNSIGSTGISDVESKAAIFERNHSTLGLAFAHDNTANRPVIQAVSAGVAFSMSLNPYGGSVGIGTTNPFGLFSIKGAGTGTGKTMVVSDSSSNIIMSMLDNGRVKIGSTTPATTLFDVDGVISSGADGNIGGGELRSYQVPGFYVGLKTDTTVNKSGLYRSNAGGDKFFSWYNTGNGDTGIATVGGAGANIILFDNANEAMRIRNSMVSIGAAKFPAHSLDVTQPAMSTAKTASYDAIKATNTATSSTASVRMSGIETVVTGVNNGTGASNVGVYVSSVSGGTTNYDAIFNGTGVVGIGTTSPKTSLVVQGYVQSVIANGVATSTCTTAIEGAQVYNLGNHHLWLCMGSEPWTLLK